MKTCRIFERIRGMVPWVLTIAVVAIISYVETRTVIGTFLSIIGFVIIIFVGAVISATSAHVAESLGEKTRQASSEELEREDDVLLQAVAFSQSVLFIYLNLIPNADVITLFKIIVPIFAVVFYALRAWGKITNNPKYRYWSIWLLFFIMLNTIFMFVYSWIRTFIVFDNSGIPEYIIILPYIGIVSGSMKFIEEIFKKRYGYQ